MEKSIAYTFITGYLVYYVDFILDSIMNIERNMCMLRLTTAGVALTAFAYMAVLQDQGTSGSIPDITQIGHAVSYDGVFVPFPDPEKVTHATRTLTLPPEWNSECGAYPDQTTDPYLSEQKSLMWPIPYEENSESEDCPSPYVGYDYIADMLEKHIPENERRPVTLVMMDSGLDADHEDWCPDQIDKKLSKTFLDSVGIDSSPLTDEVGHGTAVAGVAAACTDNGIGIASYGRGHYEIASVKIMFPYAGGGIVNTSDWKRAMQYLDDQSRQDENRQFVVNMSFSGFLYNESVESIINTLPANVHLFAGSGNDQYGTPHNTLYYPAGYDRVHPVGATVDDSPDMLCGFSYYSTNHPKFTAASGCFDIWGFSTDTENSFPYRDGLSGTSFASPQLAGMYGYFLHIFPDIAPEDIIQTIYETSRAIHTSTQGELEGPIRAINPLAAIRQLAAMAGYEDVIKPPHSVLNTHYLPFVSAE